MDDGGVAGMDHIAVFVFAVVGFTLFFASIASSYGARQERERETRVHELADRLLAAFLDDGRWTSVRGVLLADALDRIEDGDLAGFAPGHPFAVSVSALGSGNRWSFGRAVGLEFAVASTSANIVDGTVDAARVVAMVGAP